MATFSKNLLKEGNGISYPRDGEVAIVKYTGWLYDGTQPGSRGEVFSSSNPHGDFAFIVGADTVIEGMEQAVKAMTLGEKSIFTIPPDLALNTAKTHLIFEIELIGIRVPRRLNLPENMLLLSLILIVADGRHRKGFALPLELVVCRPAKTWTPEVEKWSNEMWEHVLFHITKHWQLLQGFSVTLRDLKGELLTVIDELKRISGGAENIFRRPCPILKRAAISRDAETASDRHRGLTGNSTWRLLCLSVAVEFSGKEPGLDLRAAVTDISELRSLLNQSPLFAASPISVAETELGFRILQQWLFPPSNRPSHNEAPLEGTLAVPLKVKKRPSKEFTSSPTQSPPKKREKGEPPGGSRKG